MAGMNHHIRFARQWFKHTKRNKSIYCLSLLTSLSYEKGNGWRGIVGKVFI
jgi:hypothetical protein